MAKKNTAAVAEELAQPILEEMGLLLWQTVDHKFSIRTIHTTFKNGIEIFFSLDTIAFSQTPTPSFKFILLYHNFKKNQ